MKQLPKPRRTSLRAVGIFFAVWPVLASGSIEALPLDNAGFELDISDNGSSAGWEVSSNGQTVERDFQVKSEGTASLRICSSAPRSSTMVRQAIPSAWVRAHGVRFSGLVRTEDVQGTATLFTVVGDESARIFVDDMSDRPVQGTKGWTAVDIRIPKLVDAESVEVGVLVIGAGTAWFDALELEPIQSGEAMSDAARDYLNEALDIMEQRSIIARRSTGRFCARR